MTGVYQRRMECAKCSYDMSSWLHKDVVGEYIKALTYHFDALTVLWEPWFLSLMKNSLYPRRDMLESVAKIDLRKAFDLAIRDEGTPQCSKKHW